MLSLRLITDKNDANALYRALGCGEDAEGVQFVFVDEGKDVGFARIAIKNDYAFVDRVFFAPEVETGDKNFFFRSVLFKFQTTALTLGIKGLHDELQKFGFEKNDDGNMYVKSENIDLNGECESHKRETAEKEKKN